MTMVPEKAWKTLDELIEVRRKYAALKATVEAAGGHVEKNAVSIPTAQRYLAIKDPGAQGFKTLLVDTKHRSVLGKLEPAWASRLARQLNSQDERTS